MKNDVMLFIIFGNRSEPNLHVKAQLRELEFNLTKLHWFWLSD